MDETRNYPIFTIVDANLKFNKPELKLSIDRQKARTLGVSTSDIAQTIQAAFSGQRFGFFIKDGKQYQVIGQLSRENRDAPIDLKSTYVKNNRGELIRLIMLFTLKNKVHRLSFIDSTAMSRQQFLQD